MDSNTVVTMRPYAGADDLRAMQGLTQRIWSLATTWHIGDLAWLRSNHAGREAEWPTALWEADGQVAAWGWVQPPDSLLMAVDPARPELADAVLDWFAATAAARPRTITVLDNETQLIDTLHGRGYTLTDLPYRLTAQIHPLTDLPDPVLPDGYRARPVAGYADLARRVEVHQAVWHPSKMTEQSYRAVMAAWPYRADLDWIIEAPDGTFAANCLIWFDEHNRVGELEPVGTHPDFRRKGLARAVCLAAMHALRRLGATRAVVYPVDGDPRSEGSIPLYRDLGFTEYARPLTYSHS